MFRRAALILLLAAPALAADLEVSVKPGEALGPISPYVYGLNGQDAEGLRVTVMRSGGNRMTGYNWVNNASNAGKDWHHSSDDWICSGTLNITDCDQPGAVYRHFVWDNQKRCLDSLVTLQMAGYVAADKSGEVTEKEAAPSKRWKKVSFHKKGPYTLTPDPKTATVYEDEFVHFLVSNYKKASEGGIKFYALDNEPALWPDTHSRLHPKK